MVEEIVAISGVGASHWQAFDGVSPGGRRMAGWVCRHESEWLGMLALTALDGEARLEFIPAMPKIHYPYHFIGDGPPQVIIPVPPDLVDARFTLKLDGTAIIFYGLPDAQGNIVEVIPRTRLQPVLTPSRWGDWPALLADALPDRAAVERAVRDEGVALVFELWGYRNAHLVRYEVPLALTLHTAIHARRRQPLPFPPLARLAARYGFDLVPSLDVVPGATGLAEAYRRWQAEMEARNQAATTGSERVYVSEGAILVLSTADRATPYKCKPPSIEEVHWTPDQHISGEVVRQALLKLAENGYDFAAGTVADVEATLAADFGPAEIEGAGALIAREFQSFAAEQQQRVRLRELVEASGLPPHDLPALMRYLSPHYPKQQMSWVYGAVRAMYG